MRAKIGIPLLACIGVTAAVTKKSSSKRGGDPYSLLARSIQSRLNAPPESENSGSSTNYDVGTISSALRSLSTAQAALKKIDGTAHEMYQRTHKSSTSLDDDAEEDDAEEGGGKIGGLKVAGRMSRNAARVGCIADALFAAELCELIGMAPPAVNDMSAEAINQKEVVEEINNILYGEEGTLAPWTGRKVVLNTTIHADPLHENNNGLAISVLVIYESDYNGGAGVHHGGVDDLLSFAKEEIEEDEYDEDNDSSKKKKNSTEMASPRGRYLIILSDHCASRSETKSQQSLPSSISSSGLPSIISILDEPPERLRLHPRQGGGDNVEATVCGPLYQMAQHLLEIIGPVIMEKKLENAPKKKSRDDGDRSEEEERATATDEHNGNAQNLPAIHFVGHSLAGGVGAIAANILDGNLPMMRQKRTSKKKRQSISSSLSGFARARTSALCLGPPPCLSSNLQSPFVTSVIHGDDIVCRTSHLTIDHLCDRVRRSIKGGLFGRSVGWMSEAVSLTVSGLKSDSKKKGGKLVVPGKVFLVRPRRIGGGSSSIHEVGGRGREALRAALLWQLNDVLLSKSLWSHHSMDAYIRSLDKVRLKGFADDNDNDE